MKLIALLLALFVVGWMASNAWVAKKSPALLGGQAANEAGALPSPQAAADAVNKALVQGAEQNEKRLQEATGAK